MSTQLRFASRMACIAAFGLMALMSGAKAHAQSLTVTSFSATGSPGGYNDVSDTVNFGASFNNIPSIGGYGYAITTDVMYYSGPYLSGTLLQSTSKLVYNSSGSLSPGNNNISANFAVNTPAILRASEPAGTQSIFYIYHVQVSGGCNGWGDSFSTYCTPYFIVHG
ncbi:MAG: hypothetical protein JWQ02_3849 [Capsulimonas sp.]|jgi:hypothetical protein|nr:hypothetical protein [Capsulimonas sp.]